MVPAELAETIVAVDDGPVHNLGIPQDEVGICLIVNEKKDRKQNSQIKQLCNLDSRQNFLSRVYSLVI